MPSVTALIKFTQGIAGTPGQVFVGSTGAAVTVTNNSNTNVNSWQIDLVYTPPGSAVPVAVPLAFNDADATPTANFTPDVPGSYRLVLKVWAVINRTGNNYDVDIRNFVVPLPNGLILPPYQKDPDRLPTLASGRPGAKPNEMNINGTELGWAGDGTDGLLNQALPNIPEAGTVLGQLATWNGTAWVANQQALWLAQTTWYINTATGSDAAVGDVANPLASFVEFQKRMSGQVLDTYYQVNITGDIAKLPIDFDIGANGWLDIIFAVKATSAPYNIAAFTAGSPFITGAVDEIQTVELATAATLTGQRIRFTTGAAQQCTAWAAFDLTAYVDDHSFELTRPVSFTYLNGTWVFANPAPGDQFVVDTLPVVSAVSVHIRRRGGQGFCFAIRNAHFGDVGSPVQDPIFSVEGWGYTVGCAWNAQALQTDGYHVSDGFLQGSTIRGLSVPVDKARFLASYLKGNLNGSNIVWWHSIVAHGSLVCEAGELHVIGMCAILNDAADGVVNGFAAFNSACRPTISTDGFAGGYLLILFCTNGLNIPPGCCVAYVVPPVVTGCTNYALIGADVVVNSAGIPHIEAASNAALVVGMLGDVGS